MFTCLFLTIIPSRISLICTSFSATVLCSRIRQRPNLVDGVGMTNIVLYSSTAVTDRLA